jgi:hypothetical protein
VLSHLAASTAVAAAATLLLLRTFIAARCSVT